MLASIGSDRHCEDEVKREAAQDVQRWTSSDHFHGACELHDRDGAVSNMGVKHVPF